MDLINIEEVCIVMLIVISIYILCELTREHNDVGASKPEPPPLNKGIPVTTELLEWLHKGGHEGSMNLIIERDTYGINKYGQRLMTQDGRNSIEDARQELGDAMQYIYKAKLNKENTSCLEEYYYVLGKILQINDE
jgi:hypothetical protein